MAQAIVMIVQWKSGQPYPQKRGQESKEKGEGERKEGEGNGLPDGLHYLNSFVPRLLHLGYRESESVCESGGEEREGGVNE